ncbi:MAG TPA: hypothetical protein VND65_10855 [Candidatus Binatia bacterium]|nr:hypothetical protein [Candidatus Binatia bacterium]
MTRRKSWTLAAAISALVCSAGAALAQEMQVKPEVTPRYVTLPPRLRYDVLPPATPLTTWNGSFTYSGTNYTYNMVGTNPTSNSSTTVQVYVIPLKVVITSRRGSSTFDPQHVLSNGNTVVTNTTTSPIFDSTTTYTQGGVDVGTTQYEDAFQRANFWGTVKTNSSYHVLLGGPTVLAEQTLSPPSRYGTTGSPFGFTAGLVDINWFDSQIQSLISKFTQIQPNTLPIFLTYDVYLTESGQCCIGGYHSSEGSISAPQAYAHFTYVDHPGDFAQDVSALSHEVGEWLDDPLVVNVNGNNTPCGILEVGDPLEGNANYGGYPYTLHGFTYNLQDLVTLPYFGAPPSTSVNDWFTFQGESLSVCQNGS